MKYRLFRIYADGMVEPFGGRVETRRKARDVAQHAAMKPGQVNWGTAWGYPESAVTPLFPA